MLNHTDIDERLRNVSFIKGSSPRWLFIGKVRNLKNLRSNTTVSVLFINCSRELKMGLGRDFPQRSLTKNVRL